MTPNNILDPFIEHFKKAGFKLPDDLVEWLILLLQREIDNNYPSLNYDPKHDKLEYRNPALRIAKGLQYIFERLPKKYCDPDKAKLTATLSQLIHITDQDVNYLYGLRTPTEMYEYWEEERQYKNEIEELQSTIERRESGEDVSWERGRLRRAKESLKDLEPPEKTPHLTQFWREILNFNVSFELPPTYRYQHTLVLGNSGSGKSVLLRFLLHQDLNTNAAIICIAPKGELIPKLAARIDPDRLILVSPQHPIALNIFDLGSNDTSEAAVNRTVGLINYTITSILEADTTGNQDTLLNYCIRLMLLIPEATLHTLMDLLKEERVPEDYLPYVAQLSKAARDFFHLDFCDKSQFGYQGTKKQVRKRINIMFSTNTAIERLFSNTKTEVDMQHVFDTGKCLLIDTSLSEYNAEGSAFIGRFFMGLVTLATYARKGKNLRPVYVYVDECWMYVTPELAEFLLLAREFRVGLTLSLQELSFLRKVSEGLEKAALSAITKFIGSCDPDDAQRLTKYLPDIDARALHHPPENYFHLYARNFTPACIRLKADINYLDNIPERKRVVVSMPSHPTSSHITTTQKPTEPPAREGEFLPRPTKLIPKGSPDPGTDASTEW